MPPLFSRFRRLNERESTQPRAMLVDPSTSPATVRSVNANLLFASSNMNRPPVEQVIDGLLDILKTYLPAVVAAIPAPTVSIRSMREKPLAIGNDRGLEKRGLLGIVALKGGRLEAVVRFQVWASDPVAADASMQTMQGQILTDRLNLQAQGFLQLKVEETTLSENVAILSAWRTTSDLKVLYEFHYDNTDGAESIIASIPIHSDPETRNSPDRETNTITDAIVRWDDESASVLSIRGDSVAAVNGLSSLSYVPGAWTGGVVTLSRLNLESVGAPTVYPDLATFLTAVTDENSPDLHAMVTFPDTTAFLNEFTVAGDPIGLGDWDEDTVQDLYQSATLGFLSPVRLEGSNAIFQLAYQDVMLDSKAVIYLRGDTNNR